jgi:hypothetical protein
MDETAYGVDSERSSALVIGKAPPSASLAGMSNDLVALDR